MAAVGGDSGGRECPSSGSLAAFTSQACSSAVAEFGQSGLQLHCCEEAGGVVLLAKGAALSRVHFTRDHAGEEKTDKNNLNLLDRLSDAGSATLASLASHLKPHSHSILQTNSNNGVLFFLGFVIIVASLVIVMRYRDRHKHEIYGLPAEVDEEESGSSHGWKHESWVRSKHHRQPGDSPEAPPRGPPPGFARGPQHHKTLEEEALERQMRAEPPGSAASMAASSSAGPVRHGHGIRAQGTAFLSVAAQKEHEAQQRLEQAIEREEEALYEAKERAIEGVKKLGDAGFNAAQQAAEDSRKNAELAAKKLHSTTMSTLKHIDKHTGKAFTVLNQRVDATTARLQMRWDEARSSNM